MTTEAILVKESQLTDQYPNSMPYAQPCDANDLQAGDTVLLELSAPEEGSPDDVVFVLPKIPGAQDDSDILVDEPSEIEVEEPKDVEISDDPWDWHSKGAANFLGWLKSMMDGVPSHTGRDTTGLEKAISYFEALDKEITRAMRSDYKNEIDAAKAEMAREQIEKGLDRLVDRLEKVRVSKFPRGKKSKKAGEVENGLVKEAQKTTHVGGIIITVPLLISRLARVIINGMVSGGHDSEDMFKKLSKKYDLTKREQAELLQLLADMNYPVRRDRGFDLDEDFDPRSSDNFDYAGNYLA